MKGLDQGCTRFQSENPNDKDCNIIDFQVNNFKRANTQVRPYMYLVGANLRVRPI